jgi:hypothetical protein
VHVLEDGICVTCTPVVARSVEHVLVDGVCSCTRTVARFDPTEPRDPHSGKWTDGPGSAISDALKLAGRIKLGDGEKLHSSTKVGDSLGDTSLAMARIDGPDGSEFRLGFVHPEDTGRWSGANKGGTVKLDERGVKQLREVLADAPTEGKKSVADYNKQARAAAAKDLPHSEWPNAEATLFSGVIRGSGWGDIGWSLDRIEGEGEIGDSGMPDAGWELRLKVLTPGGEESAASDDFAISNQAARVKKLDTALADLTTP